MAKFIRLGELRICPGDVMAYARDYYSGEHGKLNIWLKSDHAALEVPDETGALLERLDRCMEEL